MDEIWVVNCAATSTTDNTWLMKFFANLLLFYIIKFFPACILLEGNTIVRIFVHSDEIRSSKYSIMLFFSFLFHRFP